MKRWRVFVLLIPVLLVGIGFALLEWLEPEYAYMPSENNIMNPSAASSLKTAGVRYYDLWGQTIISKDTSKLQDSGAVEVDEKLLKLGRKALYKETFGNEVFMTDMLGVIDGTFTLSNLTKAIIQLKSKGTNNLRVELADDITIGDRTYRKGEKDGRLKVGISCMACHATVDSKSKKVIEGAPNSDLNAGLMLALATNSAAYFTHTDIANVKKYLDDIKRHVSTESGGTEPLPIPKALEKAADEVLVQWPRGNFDSTIDMKSNPAQIPDSFTKHGHPYGWSGFAMAGPFHGLAAFSNNVHSQNSDSLSQSEASKALFNMDKELYIGIILQNAANPRLRFDPKSGKKPSDFFAKIDPILDLLAR